MMAEGDYETMDSNRFAHTNGVDNGQIEEPEPDFSDPPGFVDDSSDQDLMGDVLKTEPKESDGLENVIVVDNIPCVGSDRIDKLKNVLHKLFSKAGDITSEHYALDDKGSTKGYVFIEYQSKEAATDAVKLYDGHKLDKTHILVINLFTDIEKYSNISDNWQPPQPNEYVDRGNLKYWLQNPDACDEFVVIHEGGNATTVYLNTLPEPRVLKTRQHWTEANIVWSPKGTYLATYHKRGTCVWGGENFDQIRRFAHDGVNYMDFSPCENYLITLSPALANFDDPNAFIVWDIRTGRMKRSFPADRQSNEKLMWPVFKWSPDDKYFARVTEDTLSIYETPSMNLLEKKSLKIPGIRNFSWSPKSNILAYWVAETKDVPARVTLIEVPSKKEVRAKNLFNVADAKMHWQKAGDYLCVKVDRYTKVKREKQADSKQEKLTYTGLYVNFEMFHMKQRQIPVDSIELKEPVIAFAWEPVGNKFAIIHGDVPQNYSVSFYGIKTSGTTVCLLKKFDGKTYTQLFWSPTGQHILLAGLKSANYPLEFIDTFDFSITATTEHFMATDVEWDPTGRYVVTSNSFWIHRADNSFWFWTFQGRLLRKIALDGFCTLSWRPRPPCLLSDKRMEDIKRNLKKYSPQFELKDRLALTRVSEELLQKRRQLMEEFSSYKEKREARFKSMQAIRARLREGKDDLSAEEVEEETVQIFTKQEITPVEE